MRTINQQDILRVKLAMSDFEENLQFVSTLQAQRDRLLAAAKAVPDPEEEGHCPICGPMDLIEVGKAYKWQHLPECWYYDLRQAVAKCEE